MLIILHCEGETKHPPFKHLCLLQNNTVQEPWQKRKGLIYISVNLPSVDGIIFLEIYKITQIKKNSLYSTFVKIPHYYCNTRWPCKD